MNKKNLNQKQERRVRGAGQVSLTPGRKVRPTAVSHLAWAMEWGERPWGSPPQHCKGRREDGPGYLGDLRRGLQRSPVDACLAATLSLSQTLSSTTTGPLTGRGRFRGGPALNLAGCLSCWRKDLKTEGDGRKLGKYKKKKSQKTQRLLWWGWQLCEKFRKWWESDLSKGNGDHGPLSWLKLLHLDVHFFPFHSEVSGCMWAAWYRVEWIEIEEKKAWVNTRPVFSLCVGRRFMILFKSYTSLKCFSISPESNMLFKS